MQKRVLVVLCALLCCLPLAAGAEDAAASPLIFTGKTEAKETTTVAAPFGGTVLDFSLKAGDRVAEGDVLMSLDTIKVYAPFDGTVRGIFARAGDTAAVVQSRYGALCYIEPTERYLVQSATSQGYDSDENRFVHMGETVYLRAINNTDREGLGRIIAVSGEAYTVQVLDSDLEMREAVNIYRDDDYENESRIGRGVVARADPVPISADGAVLSIAVREGTTVRRGDLLFELVSGTLDGMTAVSPSVRAPAEGIIASVSTAPGQAVAKGQPVAVLYPLASMQLVSNVSEIDLGRVSIGDAVRIVFDGLPDKSYEGTIAAISAVGAVSQDYTEYAVYIDFTPDNLVQLGMSATAYPVN